MSDTIKKISVPQPDKVTYETEGRLFTSKYDAEDYLRRKNILRVFVVVSLISPGRAEVFSTRVLAQDSLKFVPEDRRDRYKIVECLVDDIIR